MWSLDDSRGKPLLSLRGIGKSYAVPVLTDVVLDLGPGEVHALMGANGAGKSHARAHRLRPDDGGSRAR